jgi:hypothetical protein
MKERKVMLGKVTVWQMTEEERLAYIAKHPIRPTEKPKGSGYDHANIDHEKINKRKGRKKK